LYQFFPFYRHRLAIGNGGMSVRSREAQAREAPLMPARSAGIILYRGTGEELEVLLVHPGGPFWRNRDLSAWQMPKRLVEPGEEEGTPPGARSPRSSASRSTACSSR